MEVLLTDIGQSSRLQISKHSFYRADTEQILKFTEYQEYLHCRITVNMLLVHANESACFGCQSQQTLVCVNHGNQVFFVCNVVELSNGQISYLFYSKVEFQLRPCHCVTRPTYFI